MLFRSNISNMPHTLTLTATDKAGNVSSPNATLILTVDNSAPAALTLDVPSKTTVGGVNYVKGSPITITGTVPTTTNLANWTLTDGATVLATGAGGSINFTTWTPLDGSHLLTLTAAYNAGNSISTSLPVVVDNTPPTVTFQFPANNADTPVPLNANMTANIFDANPGTAGMQFLRTVTVRPFAGGTLIDISAKATFNAATGVLSIPLSSFPDIPASSIVQEGAHLHYEVTVTDLAGNVSSPIAVTNVLVSGNTSASTIQINQIAGGPGGTINFTRPSQTDPFPTGNSGYGEVAYIRDTVSVFGQVNSTSLRRYKVGIFDSTGTVLKQSVSDVTTATSLVAFTSFLGTASTTLGNMTTTAAPQNGRFTLRLQALDVNGNELTGTAAPADATLLPIIIDSVPPIVNFDAGTPANGVFTKSGITVGLTVRDAYPDTVTLNVSGAATAPVTVQSGAYSTTLNVQKAYTADGAYVFSGTALDKSGNAASVPASRKIVIDTVKPVIQTPTISPRLEDPSIPGHPGNIYVGGNNLAISAVITDPGDADPDNRVTWTIDFYNGDGVTKRGTLNANTEPVTGQVVAKATLPTLALTNGHYVIKVTATDKAGNTADTVTLPIIVSNGTYINGVPTPDAALLAYNIPADSSPKIPVQLTDNATLTVPVPNPTGMFDEFGDPFTPNGQLNGLPNGSPDSRNSKGKTLYSSGGFFITAVLQNSVRANWTESGPVTGQYSLGGVEDFGRPFILKQAAPRTKPGLYQYALIAVDAGFNAASALLNVVVDNQPPTASIALPDTNLSGHIQTFSPGDILTLKFQVTNPEKTANGPSNTFAPILRLRDKDNKPQSAPSCKLRITTNGSPVGPVAKDKQGNSLGQYYDLVSALQAQNLQDAAAHGSAQVTGDQINGYQVQWQIRLFSAFYSAGTTYHLKIDGLQDVSGNAISGSSGSIQLDFKVGN